MKKRLKTSEFKELEKYGFFYQSTYGRQLTADEHCHEFYEIVITRNGKCKQCINGVVHTMSVGDIILLGPNNTHYFVSQEKNTTLFSISITVEMLEKALLPYKNKNHLLMHDIILNKKLNSTELNFLSEVFMKIQYMPDIFSTDNRMILLQSILVVLLDNLSFENYQNTDTPTALTNILQQMNSSENIKLGMDALLQISNFSHSHLCRMFKKYLKMSPHQYITSLRMNYAYNLVISSNLSFEEISETVGFSSFSHFSIKFKESFKKTPSALRKAQKFQSI